MSENLPEIKRNQPSIINDSLPIGEVTNQVQLIQQVMAGVMKADEHYGIIPGTKKPSLYKAGAEKLCLVFRLQPDYEIIEKVREERFIAYTVRCTLTHIPTGKIWATGVGSCNVREAKYRYRSQDTGRPVPSKYWEMRDNKILGGPQYEAKKRDGKWTIVEQIEHDNPWDYDNTLIKMACKRAMVAATLNATAASDIFTQDLEDMPAMNGEPIDVTPANPEPSPEPERPPLASDGQRKKMFAIMKEAGLTKEEMSRVIEERYGLTSSKEMTKEQAADFITHMENLLKPEPPANTTEEPPPREPGEDEELFPNNEPPYRALPEVAIRVKHLLKIEPEAWVPGFVKWAYVEHGKDKRHDLDAIALHCMKSLADPDFKSQAQEWVKHNE